MVSNKKKKIAFSVRTVIKKFFLVIKKGSKNKLEKVATLATLLHKW